MQSNRDEEWPSPSDIPLPSCLTSILFHPSHKNLSQSMDSAEELPHRHSTTSLSNAVVAPEEIERAIDEYLWQSTHNNISSAEQVDDKEMYKQRNNKYYSKPHEKDKNEELESTVDENGMNINEFATHNERHKNNDHINHDDHRGYEDKNKYVSMKYNNSVKGKCFTSPNIVYISDSNNRNNKYKKTKTDNKDEMESNNRQERHLQERKKQKERNPVKWNSSCKVDTNNNFNNNERSKSKQQQQEHQQEKMESRMLRVNRSLSTRVTPSATPSWSSVERQSSELLSTAQHYVSEIEQMYFALKRTFDEVESKRQQMSVRDAIHMNQNEIESRANKESEEEVEVAKANEKTEGKKKSIAKEINVVRGFNKSNNEKNTSDVKRKEPVITKAKHEAAIQLKQQLAKLQSQWNRLQMLSTQRHSNNRSGEGDNNEKKKMQPILNPDSVHALIQVRRNALQV